MPQKIENKDIFSPDFLEPQKKSFKEIIELIKLMESEMKDVLKVQQQLVKTSDKKSVEGLKKRQRAVQSVNVVSKEMLKLEKQRSSAIAQLAIAETNESKALVSTRIELQRKRKAVKDEILAEKGLVSEYQKQSATLNNLRKKYKDLILVQGKETRATRKLRREITTLDKRLKKVDAATGQFQRSVGNYGKAFGKVTSSLRNFGLAVGGLAVIRNITGIVRGFEQAQADLASVLGVNVEGMKALTDQARELGATTRFTAGEVSQLQKEFAKLGFDQTEIQAMTEATLQLAAATGTELPRAAEVTGATLRGFGLDASETQRVVDVMAKSFSSSSLDMEKFATAMSSVAPVAKTAGLSVEKTTALLGTLTDRGLDASTAGTGLRNIFLELSKRGLSFEEAMLQINSATDKNAASLELFGKRGATVGTILSETAEDVSNLEGKLNDAGGAAQEMADKQLNTLNGALDLLKSAWEGFILDLEEGTGVFGGLKDIIFAVARNFTTIVKVIKTAAIAWGSYRIALMLVNKETGKFKRFGLISFFRKLVLGLKGLAKRGKSAALSLRGIGTAMKSIPLVAIISGITTVISLLWDFIGGVDESTEALNEESEALEESNKQLTERQRLLQLFSGETKSIAEQIKSISSLTDAQLKNLLEQAKTQLTTATELGNESVKQSAKTTGLLAENSKTQLEINNEIINAEESLQKAREEGDNSSILFFERQIKQIKSKRDVLNLTQNDVNDIRDNSIKKISEEEKANLELTKSQIKAIEAELKNRKLSKKGGRTRSKQIVSQNDLLKKQNKLKKDAFDTTQTIGQQEQQQLKESIKLQEIAAEKELALQLEIAANKPEDVNVDELERLLNERFDLIKRALEDERDLMLLNEDLTVEERELINIQFNNKLAENERNRVKTIDDANNEIIDGQIETADKIAEVNKKADDDLAAARKKNQQDQLNALREFAAKAIEIADAKTDKEIENIDKELEANKNRQQQLEALAAQGNLTAQQSIGAEIKREIELERQKEALEKKKARRQIILEGLDLLSSKIDSGQKDAVTSTLNDMTRLLGALSALPGFIDGTETTVGAALGKPQLNTGTDDYIVRVDGSEKILNPGMSARTGNMTTEEITRAAEMYSSGMFDQNLLIHPQVTALNQPFQNSNEILKKFDSLESTIRNKPILSDLKFDDLQKALVVTVEQNGDLKRAHYKLK